MIRKLSLGILRGLIYIHTRKPSILHRGKEGRKENGVKNPFHLLIYSFTHLLIYSFTHLLIYSFTHLLIYSFTHLLIYLFFRFKIYECVDY